MDVRNTDIMKRIRDVLNGLSILSDGGVIHYFPDLTTKTAEASLVSTRLPLNPIHGLVLRLQSREHKVE